MSGPYQVVSHEPGLQIDDPGWAVLDGKSIPIAITETETVAELLQERLQAISDELSTYEFNVTEYHEAENEYLRDVGYRFQAPDLIHAVNQLFDTYLHSGNVRLSCIDSYQILTE